jgi:hypothetical protein
MRARAVLASLATLAAAVGLLVALAPARPSGPRRRTAARGAYREVGSRGVFHRTDGREAYELGYGFVDYEGESHDVACRVLRRDHQQAIARFGYVEKDLEAAALARQQTWADERLRERGLLPYFRIDVGTERLGIRAVATADAMASAGAEKVGAMVEAVQALRQEVRDRRREFEADFLRERGFRLQGDEISIDYPRLVDWYAAAVDDCAKALRWAGAGYEERQYLGMFVAFLQEIPYALPPDVVGGKETLGLYVPTEVLVGDHGDCDSKSVTFVALWRGFGP